MLLLNELLTATIRSAYRNTSERTTQGQMIKNIECWFRKELWTQTCVMQLSFDKKWQKKYSKREHHS